jgi:hypothetical protein
MEVRWAATVLYAGHYAIACLFAWIALRHIHKFITLMTNLQKTATPGNKTVLAADESNVIGRCRIQFMKKTWILFVLRSFQFVVLSRFRIILGSFPYMWVLILLGVSTTMAASIGITSMFPQYQGKTSSNRHGIVETAK